MSVGPASTVYIKRIIREDLGKRMQDDLEKLLQDCPQTERKKYQEENKGFLNLYKRYISASEKPLQWEGVETFPKGSLFDYNNFLTPKRSIVQHLLEKLIVVKLNGGLGTRMKCNGPKSLIPVRNGLNFLDLTVQQIENLNIEYDANVPLILMNSFNTIDETEKAIRKYQNLRIKICTFNQSRYPRIYAESRELVPSSYKDADRACWYPPGHGNFYESFVASGLLEEFQAIGKEFCFVSNIDNLGAIVDFRLLNLMTVNRQTKPPEFIMELTEKTAADTKGGTLIHYKGKLKLLEYAEVPKEHIEDFKCTRKFSNFNTNNLWINLEALKRMVTEVSLSLDVIPNKKRIVMDSAKVEVIQLETAAGAAIGMFDGALGIMVPRVRFLPVKTTSDLFLTRSNVYINDNGKLLVNPLRPYREVPIISLADEHFGDYRDLEKRIESMPDCLQLHHLTICGNVYIAKDVVLKGNVTIVASNSSRVDIPRGAVLQYKIVTGSLRIVDF